MNEFGDARIGPFDVFSGKASAFALLIHQEALGDFHLFNFGVAGKTDHFHTVLQSGRDSVQHVGGGHEENFAEVVFDVEVVILERLVLFRVQHFEQCRGRITAEIGGHLVDFVEHEDGVLSAGLLHHLDYLAGERANIGTAMAADFRFIANAAERHAHELAASGLGDGHAE